jgi:tetratricopeptide (TPR) repeat protein
LAYLKGRSQSVTGHPDEAISNLYKASLNDKLGPYGIRSELLLIEDEMAREVIEKEEAIQRMERLRFAWRGDDLETQIQKSLGNLYIQNGEPRKGLNILKRAAKNTKSLQDRRAIVRVMADAYKGIFLNENFADVDPMIAIAIYDEFKELTPVGDEGNALIDGVADKLMGINLLSRATSVLSDKMHRLGKGQDAIKTGLRIAAIQLIDRNPENALKTLAKIDQMIAPYTGEDKDELLSKIVLLKARSYSDSGEPETALFMTEGLDDSDDVIRLRVDTAWRSGRWVAVTDNLSKLLARQDISASTPPTAEQTQLILNQAVALSLSDQYDALQRFAGQYDLVMKQSPSYKTFLLVSRPQNISNLADRETLLGVTAEVDLFKDFLDSLNK